MPTAFDPAEFLHIDDFDTFLNYLESKPNLPLTAGGDLKAGDLWAMNERVNYKAPDYVTNRSRQIDYPLLGFLFQVATVSRLFLVKVEKGTVLTAHRDRLELYRNLTLEEKYVFLLETAWCYADWSVIDGDGRSGLGANWFQGGLRQLLLNPVGTAVTFFQRGRSTQRDVRVINASSPSAIYIRVGHWFGWYTVDEIVQPKRDKYTLDIAGVTLIEWGQQCLTVLLRDRPFRYWNKQAGNYAYFDDQTDEPEQRVPINTFADALRMLLDEPDLLSLYPINPNPPTGMYWIQAELPNFKVSRTLATPADRTLVAVHELIQQAFAFDNDHLFKFCMNVRNPYNGEQYYDPRPEDG